MIKICSTSICKPLRLIFNHCIDSGIYPCEWKKASVLPIHKKGDKQTLKNYRPVSLLPVCSKIFEKLVNQVLNQETPALINFYQKHITFTNHLILNL